MQNRLFSALFTTMVGAMLLAAGPASAASIDDVFSPQHDSAQVNEHPADAALSDKWSFSFGSLYHQILRSTARLADYAHIDLQGLPSPSVNIRLQSATETSELDRFNLRSTERAIFGSTEEHTEGFSLQIDMSDNGAPMLSPVTERPGQARKDHLWVALGARYDYSERFSMDFGYSQLYVNETSFDRSGGVTDDIFGDFKWETDVISARFRWSFD